MADSDNADLAPLFKGLQVGRRSCTGLQVYHAFLSIPNSTANSKLLCCCTLLHQATRTFHEAVGQLSCCDNGLCALQDGCPAAALCHQ